MSVRIVVCIDVDVSDLKTAYREVYNAMGRLEESCPTIEWESTDEWYGDDGEEVDPDKLQAIRMEVFEECQSATKQ